MLSTPVEISRGPNFHPISASARSGGNSEHQHLQAGLTRESNQVTLRADSYGGYRSSLNLKSVQSSRTVLAIRMALLYAENGYLQKPSSDPQQAGVRCAPPFPIPSRTRRSEPPTSTTRKTHNGPIQLTPRDGVTDWLAAGGKTDLEPAHLHSCDRQRSADCPDSRAARGATAENYGPPCQDSSTIRFSTLGRPCTSTRRPGAALGNRTARHLEQSERQFHEQRADDARQRLPDHARPGQWREPVQCGRGDEQGALRLDERREMR